jgi:hypothetical protein
VPTYPGSGTRGGPIVSQERVDRGGDSEVESDPEWVVYLFPGRQQQPDFPSDRLGRAERAAVMAPTQTPMQLAVGSEALELSVPVQTVSAVSDGRKGEPSAWLAAHAAGRRWPESWMREIRTFQFDEGAGNVRQRNAPVPYSTGALA